MGGGGKTVYLRTAVGAVTPAKRFEPKQQISPICRKCTILETFYHTGLRPFSDKRFV